MFVKFTLVMLSVLVSLTTSNALAEAISKKNTSYSGNRLEVLPLLKLSSNKFSKDNIIFLHPPKVGGTNIVQVMKSIKSIKSRRFAVPRIKDRSPILITDGWIGGLSVLKEQCKNEHKNDCEKYKFLSGHFPFGAHNYLNGQYQYVTLIRDPLLRELSSINFDYQRGYITNKKQALNYLMNIAIDNPQTRLLAGEQYMSGTCDEKTLEIAKRNLNNKFLLVGVTEETNSFIQVLLSVLELEPIAISKAQITGKKVIHRLELKTQKQLLQKHKYDQLLYEHAKFLWNQWKQDNIIGIIPIEESKKILTILPDFANTHTPCRMTQLEIQKHNLSYPVGSKTKIHQMHQGVDKK